MGNVLSMGSKRRRFHRHPVRNLLYIDLDGANGAIVLNLSENGAEVHAVAPLSLNQRVHCGLELADRKLQLDGLVMWADASGRAGLKFQGTAETRQAIKDFLLGNTLAHTVESEAFTAPQLWAKVEAPDALRFARDLRGASHSAPASPAAAPALGVPRFAMELPGYRHLALQELAQRAHQGTRGTGAAIAITEGGVMSCGARSGNTAPDLGARLDAGASFSGLCVQQGVTLRCDDSDADARVDAAACRMLGVRSIIAAPIKANGNVVGVCEVFSDLPFAFGSNEARLVEQLADLVSLLVGVTAPAAPSAPRVAPAAAPEPALPSPSAVTAPVAAPTPAPPSAEITALPPAKKPLESAPPAPIVPATPLAAPSTRAVAPAAPTVVTPPASPSPAAATVTPPPAPVTPLRAKPAAPAPVTPATVAPVQPPAAPPPAARPVKVAVPTPAKSLSSLEPSAAPKQTALAVAAPKVPVPRPVAAPAVVARMKAAEETAASALQARPAGHPMVAWLKPAVAAVLVLASIGMGYRTWQQLSRAAGGVPLPAKAAATSAAAPSALPPTTAPPPAPKDAAVVLPTAPAVTSVRAGGATSSAAPRPAVVVPTAATPRRTEAVATLRPAERTEKPAAVSAPLLGFIASGAAPPPLPVMGASASLPILGATARPAAPPTPVASRTGGELIAQVKPSYPAEALHRGIEGDVTLDVVVGTNGHVRKVTVAKGQPSLNLAAVAAVQQWRYQPLLVNGTPTENTVQVTVKFHTTAR